MVNRNWTSAEKNRLLLLVVSIFCSLSVQSTDRCDVSSVLVPDANVDGGNRNMAGSDVTECENVCINMTSCLGFDWSRENSECYLLPPGVESINYNVYGVDHYSLIRNTNHCIGACSNPMWVPIINTHGFGGRALDGTSSLTDCAKNCTLDPGCSAFDWDPFNPEGKRCWVIGSSSATAPSQGVYHYKKTCTPISTTVAGSNASSITTIPVSDQLHSTVTSLSMTWPSPSSSSSSSSTTASTSTTVPLLQSTHPKSTSSSPSSSTTTRTTTTTTTTTTTRLPNSISAVGATSSTSRTTLPTATSVASFSSTSTTNSIGSSTNATSRTTTTTTMLSSWSTTTSSFSATSDSGTGTTLIPLWTLLSSITGTIGGSTTGDATSNDTFYSNSTTPIIMTTSILMTTPISNASPASQVSDEDQSLIAIKPTYIILAGMILCQYPLSDGEDDGLLKRAIIPYQADSAGSSNELVDMDLFVVESNPEFRSSGVIATEFEAASLN